MTMRKRHLTVLVFLIVNSVKVFSAENLFELNIVHINDFHARFDEINTSGGECKKDEPCIGGFARVSTVVKEIISQKPENTLLLSAGDNFQGTLYYSLFKWNITSQFFNTLPFDAITIGNHEFDDGIKGIVPFLEALNAPVVLSNMDDSLEPRIQGKYTKSTVVTRQGKKIGIIGLIIRSVNEISNTENLKFLDEIQSINDEAERLVREEGVFTNIVLSHTGYGLEQLIAGNASNKIGLIVGGHSHTFLYTGEHPPGPDQPGGPYPTIITGADQQTVLVTQAGCYTKYLGNLTVYYDEEGNVESWVGEPIFLDTSVPQDPDVVEMLKPWKDGVDNVGHTVLGTSLVRLERDDCRMGECILGNFIADAFVYAYTSKANPNSWTAAAIAIFNTGGIRTSIPKGNITFNDMVTAQPFENTVDVGDVTGQDLLDIYEFSATPYFYGRDFININILQQSGIILTMDLRKPIGSRIVELKVRCAECEIPTYEPVDPSKTYRLIVPSFLYRGGDGFKIIPERMKNRQVGLLDMDVFKDFIEHRSPIFIEIEGKITILGSERIVAHDLF